MIAASRSKALRGSVGSRVSEHTFVLDTCPQIAAGSLTEAVAEWMLDRVTSEGFLGHALAVVEIKERFGPACLCRNARGHLAIQPEVLKAFANRSGEQVVWSRRGRFWRVRQPSDLPGRRQP